MSPGGRTILGGGLGLLLVLGIALFTGVNPAQLLNLVVVDTPPAQNQEATPGANDQVRQFVGTVLADTEDVWGEQFAAAGKSYRKPRLVLYSGMTQIPGGVAQGATGPFYLPADQTVYLDFSFFEEMERRFEMRGDFAAAYVIAHEVGHHVQHLLGQIDQVHGRRGRIPDEEYNRLSVRLELQADFLAGVWAHHAHKRWNILEEGDVEEAMNATATVGDDRLQKATRGQVVPDSFTHGTSAQRRRWFKLGYTTGDVSRGDTFDTDQL